MIGSDAFNFVNVLGKAADASWLRNNMLTNNIANNDTPGYKRKDVRFETFLEAQLMRGGSLRDRVSNTRLNRLDGVIYTDYHALSYRKDGNNVDIHTENSYLAQNQLRYNILMDSMTQEFSRLKTALSVTTS